MQNPPARHPVPWLALLIAIIALVAATAALTATFLRPGFGAGVMGGGFGSGAYGPGMMGGGGFGAYGPGMMGGGFGSGAYGPGMMGGGFGAGMMGSDGARPAQPGDPGFVPGTEASPRVIRVTAGPGFVFTPSTIAVARGETVTFVVTTMGPAIHEFMVGPADDVATHQPGTAEIDDIGMMQTKALTYRFDGSGPFAYACHVEGHYEAGMRGTITVVG
ncbi:MAG: plastocyanin/azurin family copper-binding protein [Chloroflexota bacterium]